MRSLLSREGARGFWFTSRLVLLAALALAALFATTNAYAGAASPDKPGDLSLIWCVSVADPPVATGAPCQNPLTFRTAQEAIDNSFAGNTIRFGSGDFGTATIKQERFLEGGFSGNTGQWGARDPNCPFGCSRIHNDDSIAPSLVVSGPITVHLDYMNIYGGGIVNRTGGKIQVLNSASVLQTGNLSQDRQIEGRFEIQQGASLNIIDGIEAARDGTSFVGPGALLVGIDGTLKPQGTVYVDNYVQPTGAGFHSPTLAGGNLVVNKSMVWTAGVMKDLGVTTVMTGASLELGTPGGGPVILDNRRTFLNYGHATWNAPGYDLRMSNGAGFVNYGSFDLLDQIIFGTAGGTGTFINRGILRVPGAGVVQMHISDFNSGGVVKVQNSGKLDVPNANGAMAFLVGTYRLFGGTTATGLGTISVGGSPANGTWEIDPGATAAHPVTIPNLYLASIRDSNGISGTGVLNITKNFTWEGRLGNSGVANLVAGGVGKITGFPALDGRTFNNYGAIHTEPSTSNVLALEHNGVFNNIGTFTANAPCGFGSTTSGTFNNVGAFSFNYTETFCEIGTGVSFNNSGNFNIQAGTWYLNSGAYKQTAGVTTVTGRMLARQGAPQYTFLGGEVKGTGQLDNLYSNGATVSPGNSLGTLHVNGNYTQTGASKLNIEIGGHTVDTQYDQLTVGGQAVLAGRLDISLINGFIPAPGDSFVIMTYGSHSGAFATVTGAALPGGKTLTVHYNANDITLSVDVSGPEATQTAIAGATQTAIAVLPPATQIAIAIATQTAAAGATRTAAAGATGTAVAATRTAVAALPPATQTAIAGATQTAIAGLPPATQTAIAATATAAACSSNFADVHASDYFYQGVSYLVCHGAISGYADNTFRPFNNTTRGQLAKIVTLAQGWALANPATATFLDVPVGSTFFQFVETAVQHSIISGYTDHSFRPNNNVTRGQLSKIIVLAQGWQLANPATPTFADVLPGNAFYKEIETAVQHGIISGYDLPGGGREFRWGNPATRGQIAKIVTLAVSPSR